MSTPAKYRDLAVWCLRLARYVQGSNSKALYLDMAQVWIGLAERTEAEFAREPSGDGAWPAQHDNPPSSAPHR